MQRLVRTSFREVPGSSLNKVFEFHVAPPRHRRCLKSRLVRSWRRRVDVAYIDRRNLRIRQYPEIRELHLRRRRKRKAWFYGGEPRYWLEPDEDDGWVRCKPTIQTRQNTVPVKISQRAPKRGPLLFFLKHQGLTKHNQSLSPSSSWTRTPPFQGDDTGSNPVGDAK